MPRMYRPWTENDFAKIRKLAGKEPAASIASLLGRSTPTLRVMAHKLRLSLRLQRGAVRRPGRLIPPSAHR